jgi:hypothetical protein
VRARGGGLAPAQADARQEPAPPRAPCLERSVSPQLPPLSAAARSTTRDDARADTRGGSAAPHHAARTAQYGGGAPDDHHPSHGPVGAHAHLSSNPTGVGGRITVPPLVWGTRNPILTYSALPVRLCCWMEGS